MRKLFAVAFALGLGYSSWAQSSDGGKAGSEFFGVVSHFLHTRQIYTDKDDSWSLTRTAPLQARLGNPWVTEQIYALTAKSRALVDDGTANNADKYRISERRKLIDKWLSNYDEAGTKVLLTVMAAAPRAKNSDKINDDFGNWIAELVSRHKSIKVVQLHNEPNLRSFWPDSAADYVELYRGIAGKIKQQNPQVAITVGAISSLSWEPGRKWLREAISAGLLEFADGVSVHPYNLKEAPEIDPHLKRGSQKGSLREGMLAFWKEMKAASPAGKNLKIYLTELGYSSAPNGIAGIGSEDLQAKYLARLMMLHLDFKIRDGIPTEAVFWYDLKNDGPDASNQEHNFGLVSADLKREKPAFDVYRRIIEALPDVSELKPSTVTLTPDASDVQVHPWVDAKGRTIVAIWRTGPSKEPVNFALTSTAGVQSNTGDSLDVVSGVKSKLELKSIAGGQSFTLEDLSDVKLVTFSNGS